MLKRGLFYAGLMVWWPVGLLADSVEIETAIRKAGQAYKTAYDAGDARAWLLRELSQETDR